MTAIKSQPGLEAGTVVLFHMPQGTDETHHLVSGSVELDDGDSYWIKPHVRYVGNKDSVKRHYHQVWVIRSMEIR